MTANINRYCSLFKRNLTRLTTDIIGLDSAVIYTVLGYAISALAVPVSTWLVLTHFSQNEQGYYYTFVSLLGLQLFFELGLGQCITQFASHEFAHITITDRKTIEGSEYYRFRYIAIIKFAIKAYLFISLLAFFGIGIAGTIIFTIKPSGDIAWLIPWWCLCAANALALFLTAFTSILQGSDEIVWVAKVRVLANVFRLAVLCVLLWAGSKLIAPAVAVTAMVIIMAICITKKFWTLFLQSLKSTHPPDVLLWRKEIWPYQWRLAISWIAGYFVFNIFNPIIFLFNGPKSAGQFGLTWALLLNVSMVASAWSTTKVPRYCALISKEKWDELDATWKKNSVQSFGMCIAGCLVVIIFTIILRSLFPKYSERMLDPASCIGLASALLISNVIGSFAYYLRAFKREPFMALSIYSGLGSFLSACIMAKFFSLRGVIGGYILLMIITFPFAQSLFRKYRKDWRIPKPIDV